jgi:hypothetical protein
MTFDPDCEVPALAYDDLSPLPPEGIPDAHDERCTSTGPSKLISIESSRQPISSNPTHSITFCDGAICLIDGQRSDPVTRSRQLTWKVTDNSVMTEHLRLLCGPNDMSLP